jgi:nanoRNase/pAp phosphatase (c-di-AMP/oligoRNAs hydrolase)
VVLLLDGVAPEPDEAQPSLIQIGLDDAFRDALSSARIRLANIRNVLKLREVFAGKDRVLILLQNDPDPDAIASGLALRALLNRNRLTAPLATFGSITRPENLAMCRLLEIEVEQVRAEDVQAYGAVAVVDAQPPRLGPGLSRVQAVVDHHPDAGGFEAAFKDIRPEYGATATILCEYLRAAGMKVARRLATALTYAVKSDTFFLERDVSGADLQAFSFLYPKANINLIRRIDRPEFPSDALEDIGRALHKARVVGAVVLAHLGEVSREDLVPLFADFCLQVEGSQWSVVSGLGGGALHISVRNVGHIHSAGRVVQAAFGALGSAGGHRSMARAVIPADLLDGAGVRRSDSAIAEFVAGRFLAVLDALGAEDA